ncbi:uncharacterized protein NECHADRAFT_81608 [Fusarium vanettenii 77-13-4]|uniref:F-box domain-containing protein n=1 Tax=Fusarium vanettenii (strain ATCC MYA-4622 / CBS 123669 / FGSC 9596 / NRRL 45880 / 77-13-4) TaxID=660122 RepID=C7Z8S0_FUSV7|nr:uncharacterized protein NECHADRAFT_81608 [Fusarium vanettenii 77-13-4]EEU39435.1 hypothetical protein NECHADRAFT_81608 [Fusarium vanettenii 77-13-4]
MTLRRSARIRNQDAQGPPEPQQLQPVPLKRKAPPAKAQGVAKRNKSATEPAKPKAKAKQPNVQAQIVSNDDALSSLPPEIFNMILQSIDDRPTLGKLGRTCKKYYSIAMPYLYKHIAVAAMFHAHIPKLIRALEPVLTIAQKKQLKKEGKYKGQQERFSSRLDENAKPLCADYVRSIVVGVCDPGRKHKYITNRYLEEAFQNLNNLEIIETRVLTEQMAESIVSLKNLKALSVSTARFEEGAMRPLAKIKNLQHLFVEDYSWGMGMGKDNVVRSMLLNSRSTLRSLSMRTSSYATCFLDDWEKMVSASKSSQAHDLIALKSFTLSGVRFDEGNFLKSMQRAIDFAGLHELRLGRLAEGRHLLFQYLASLAGSAPDKHIDLRTLSVDMSHNHRIETPEQKQTGFDAKCAFISSFDTLSTLELVDYNQYQEHMVNPGLSDTLLQAILKHENLKVFRISYTGIISGCKIPYLSAETVATIVNNLPHLEEFEFAPEESEIDKIGEALAASPNLTSVTCWPHARWGNPGQEDREKIPGTNILRGILQGFMSRAGNSDNTKFVWEDHYKLKRVSVTYRAWVVASKFGKLEKGMKKEEKMKSSDEKREVLYRDISGTFLRYIHVGYDPGFEWVEKVSKDMD